MMVVDRTYLGQRETDAFDPERKWRPAYPSTRAKCECGSVLTLPFNDTVHFSAGMAWMR
jgi:hypothetical protein